MTTILPKRDRERLIGCLELWARPGTASERDAAAAAALRILEARGLTWHQVIAPAPHREPLFGTWRSTCRQLAARPYDLRSWERKFVEELPAFPRLSSKQRYVLKQIADRVLGANAP